MSWFERHPRLTLIATVLVLLGACDAIAAAVLFRPADAQREDRDLVDAFVRSVEAGENRVANPAFHHGFERDAEFTDRWGDVRYPVITDSLGLKDRSHRQFEQHPAQRRILFLGDSFTEGIGLPYESTFVGIVESRLDPSRFEVLNGAVASYSPKLYEAKLRWLLDEAHLRIDDVWVFIDLTDVHNEIQYERFQPQVAGLPPPVRPGHGGFRRFIRRHSVVGNVVDRIVHLAGSVLTVWRFHGLEDDMYEFSSDPKVAARWGDRGLALCERYMQRLVDLCRERNIRVTLAVYPHPRQIAEGNPRTDWVERWAAFATRNGTGFLDLYSAFMDPVLRVQTAIPGKPGYVGVLSRYFFRYDMHWNAEGHAFVADRIAIR